MTWTWDEIRRDWLHDGGLADEPEVVVDAFNRVESYFGRNWIEQSRVWGGVLVRGSAPTLNVVTRGREGMAIHARRCFPRVPAFASRRPRPLSRIGRGRVA